MDVSVSGGKRMAKVLAAIGRSAGRSHVKVGYLEGATYPDGVPVAQVAFWQEFGTPGARFPIPPRPTFRKMISAHKGEWGGELGKLLVDSHYDVHQSLGLMGQRIKEELTDSVLHADVAPLSPVTLMLRKMRNDDPGLKVTLTTVYQAIAKVRAGDTGATGTRARRLIETGVMERAADYEVVDGA